MPVPRLFRAVVRPLVPALVVAGVLVVGAPDSWASVTPLVGQDFAQPTVTNDWMRPVAASGTNLACLTASTNVAQSPIPGCNLATPDAAGSGALRLTSNANAQVGATFYQTSLPTTAGVDLTFDSYQWDAAGSGADGIALVLAAADPSDPVPPAMTGQVGGYLGYSASGGLNGLTHGYLGLGADVYGNFANSGLSGNGCSATPPAGLAPNTPYPESLTVRGPGDGPSGYCLIGSTAQVSHLSTTGSSNLGGGFLDKPSATTRPAPVPVEVAFNPSAAPVTTASGLSVPAMSWLIAVVPYGASQQVLTGLLPTTANTPLLGTTVPASWINPATGIPYQLTFGWTSGTGGFTDIHEVKVLSATTLTGPLPVLTLANTDNQGGAQLAGSTTSYTLTPGVSASGAAETLPITVTDTLPAGITPGTATGTGWTCSTAGQVVTCTYPSSPSVPAGTTLPAITLPATVSAAASGSYTATARISSNDGNPDLAADTTNVTQLTASAVPVSTPHGNAVTLATAGIPAGAVGSVAFTSGAASLCTAVLPATSCLTSTTLPPASYPVTATYTGSSYGTVTAATSFTVTVAGTAIAASATPSSVPFGTSSTLAVTGLAGDATGTVTFTSGATTLCTATLPAVACTSPTSLVPATYPVTATYSGDSNYTGSSAGTSLTVTKAPTAVTVSAAPTSTPHGSADTLSVGGLPVGATGSVTLTSGATTLCTVTLPGSSCLTSVSLPAGHYPVTGTYSGDGNYAGSSDTTSFDVTVAGTPSFAAAATPSSTPFGSAVTLSDSGLAADATGTVTFTSGAVTLCTVSVPVASCQPSATLPVGTYPVVAHYSGDANYSPVTAATTFDVTKADTALAVTVTPGTTTFGAPVTVSVSGLPAGATGTVTVTSGATTLCTMTLPATSCTTPPGLDPGPYPVTATYPGDPDHNGSSDTTSYTITKAPTTMTATATPASVSYGSSATLAVTGLPGGATGTVTFTSGATTLCMTTLPATSCPTSTSLGAATYPVTATYSGDTDFAPTTASTSLTVVRANPSLTATAVPPSVSYGNGVTLVAGSVPAAATGTLTFRTGATTLCTATLPATSCATASTLAAAAYPVTLTYSGDANYSSATATTSFTITPAATSIVASASPASVPYGSPETLSVGNVPAGAGGTVTFTSGATTLCTATLPATSCSPPTTLVPGAYPVTATYSGDGNHSGSSDTTSFTVTKAPTALVVSAAPVSTPHGSADTLSVGGLPVGATGSVTLTSGATTLCTVTLPGSSCLTSVSLPAGHYPVTGTYSGDGNYAGSSDTTSFDVTVAGTPSFAAAATPSSTPFGSAVTLSDSGLAADATGTVTFTSGAVTLCTVSVPVASCQPSATLPVGTYPVVAHYSGDANYSPVTAATTFDVTKADTALAVTVTPGTTTFGAPVTVSVSGLPAGATGTVTVTSGATTLCTMTLPATSCTTPPGLDPGPYPVTATYPGDPDHNGSSDTTSYTITKAPTTMTASATPASAQYGAPVLLSVSGLPTAPAATGTVTFTSGATTLCTATLPARTCNAPVPLVPGTYPVTATYSGDTDYLGTTAPTSFDVTKASVPGLTAIASPTRTTVGVPTTLSALGLPPGATGTVVFTSGTTTLCTATVGTTTSCATPVSLGAGTYPVVATYSGDSNYSPGSATTTFAVFAAPVARAAAATTHKGQPVTIVLPAPTGAGPFTFTLVDDAPAADGTCTVTPGGHLTFVPAAGFTGTATCTYQVTDAFGVSSAPADAVITVLPGTSGGGGGTGGGGSGGSGGSSGGTGGSGHLPRTGADLQAPLALGGVLLLGGLVLVAAAAVRRRRVD